MTAIDSILEAEREAEKNISAAHTEAAWIIESAKEAKERECTEERARLLEVEKKTLANHSEKLKTQVETMQKEAEAEIEQLQERAGKNKESAISVITSTFQS